MYNDWLTIGKFTIHGYGVMIAAGILIATVLAERKAKKNGLDPSEVDNIVFFCLICAWASAKILYCLTNLSDFIADPTMIFSSSGWVVYGGIIGGFLSMLWWCHFKKIDFGAYLNLILPHVALAQAFGRVGCFFAGCCYGIPTDSALGVVFPPSTIGLAGVKVVPTQLISALGDLILFLILIKMFDNEKTRNYTGTMYFVLYSIGRFFLEFLRGDVIRGNVGVLSTSQFIAIFVALAGLAVLWYIRKGKKVS